MDEITGPGTVTDIKAKVNKKKSDRPAPPTPKKPKPVEFQLDLVDCVRRKPRWGRHHPVFFSRYEVIEPAPGARVVLSVDDDEVATVVKREAVRNDLLRYIERHLDAYPDYHMDYQAITATTKLWECLAEPVPPEDIRMTRWRSEPGLTYRRLPWNMTDGECPTWVDLLSRMSNRQAFMDWVGSLLVDDSSLHGYVWIYGLGGDGKGAMNRFFDKVFGPSYRSKQPPSSNKGSYDKFWTFSLLGARLVVFPDCDNTSFVTSGFFKSLTGGDPVDLEAKGRQSFTATLNAKYLVISNEKPEISGDRSDLRRILYCELNGTPDGEDQKFEGRLWDEGGIFLTRCLNGYLQRYEDRRAISPDQTEVKSLADDNEQHFSDFFDNYFKLGPEEMCLPIAVRMASTEYLGHSRKIYSQFLRWLERTHKLKWTLETQSNGKQAKAMKGLGLTVVPVMYRRKPKPDEKPEPNLNENPY